MKNKGSTFYCFSPPVMLATFAIEIGLMLYTLIRYRMSPLTRLVAATLILLAIFQVSEYHVCTSEITTGFFSRLGYVAITLLPPVGIHLVATISGRGSKKLTAFSYITGFLFIFFFAFSATAFKSYVCGGNYAIFNLANNVAPFFSTYYYTWMFIGIAQCFKFSQTAKPKVRQALIYQAFGYLSFIVPTGIVNMINPTSISGLPSIMCGFAGIYAIILAFGITPLILETRSQSKKSQ